MFETSLQAKGQLRFSIPEDIAEMVGIRKSKKRARLSIKTLSNKTVFDDYKTLTSGKEITGANMGKFGLKPGQKIRVQVSRQK